MIDKLIWPQKFHHVALLYLPTRPKLLTIGIATPSIQKLIDTIFCKLLGFNRNKICLKQKKISIYLKCHFTSHCCTDENTSYETQSLFEKIQLKYDFYTHVTSNWQSQFSFSLNFVQSSHLGPLRTSRPLSQFGTDG